MCVAGMGGSRSQQREFLYILGSIRRTRYQFVRIPTYSPYCVRKSKRRVRYSLLRRSQISRTTQPKPRRTASVGRERREVERFESLMGELSVAMTRAQANEVDREIESWLGKICRAMDLDRSGIYERDTPSDPVRITHTWHRANVPPITRRHDPEKLFQATTRWVMAGNQITYSHPSEIPDELAGARGFVERLGPKASTGIPNCDGGRGHRAARFRRLPFGRARPRLHPPPPS